jgi:hypothetical protein
VPSDTSGTGSDPSIRAEAIRHVRVSRSHGTPIDPDLRQSFEGSIQASLEDLRLHRGPDVDRIADSLGVEAFASATDIFVHDRAHRADGSVPAWLLAHELAHAGQQATIADPDSVQRAEARLERAADRFADRFVAGDRPASPVPVRQPAAGGIVLQGHASWEHRILGEVPTGDIYAIELHSTNPNRLKLLGDLRSYLGMWQTNPTSVTAKMVTDRYPYIRTYTLQPSGLLTTYGELTTLPDYFADSDAMADQPSTILLPILQAVRQEGYNKISRLIDPTSKPVRFQGAVAINTGWDFIDLLIETLALDKLTWNLGPDHTDHYTAVVARNACHFAPYSWYRWRESFLAAQAHATQAYQAPANQKAYYTNLAWLSQGYAEHFLQDSFAAGHLVNKTLIMQWFIEWYGQNNIWHIADWAQISTMTENRQPYIAAPGLYDWTNPGVVRDPQTMTQGQSLQDRIAMSGVVADGTTPVEQSYQNFLALLNGTVGQSASGVLHDHFNKASLTVASVQRTVPYQVFGDDTMLDSDGAFWASLVAKLSQDSILDLLSTGSTTKSADLIYSYFPTSVQAGSGQMLPLETWQLSAEIRSLAQDLFPSVHWRWLSARPRIGYVSTDLEAELTLAPA